jgi:hypothetical protein
MRKEDCRVSLMLNNYEESGEVSLSPRDKKETSYNLT